jgi:Cof subfamily protein (haloacid dehalogenase superfamily)
VISEYTIRTLHRVNQAGVKIVPISGRPLCHLKPVISNIQNLEYVATANGSAIIDLKCDRILKQFPLKLEIVHEIFDLMDSMGHKPAVFVNGFIFDENGVFDPPGIQKGVGNSFGKEMDRRVREKGLQESLLTGEYPIDELALSFECAQEKQRVQNALKEIKGIVLSYAFEKNLEINAQEATKGNALEEIAKIYGIPLEQTMAIGDGVNDISMIERAGIGVVMGNALEGLQGHGDYVTLSNDEDGAAKAIEKFVL